MRNVKPSAKSSGSPAPQAPKKTTTQTAAPPESGSPDPSTTVADHRQPAAAARKRILIVSHMKPFAPRAGNEQHLYRMLRWMSEQGYDVIYVFIAHENITDSDLDEARRYLYRVHRIDLGQRWNRLRHYRRTFLEGARNLVWHLENADWGLEDLAKPLHPLRIAAFDELWCPDHAAEQVKVLIRQYKPDVVMAQYIFMSRCLPGPDSNALRIIDTHDLFSTRYKHLKNTNIVEYHQALSAEEEALLLNRADVIMTSQDDEAQAIRDMGLMQRVFTIAIDMDLPAPARKGSETPGEVLIVASLNEPNLRGIRGFLEMVWPTVRAAIPEAKLRIVGHVCEKLKEHADDPSILLNGYVPSLAEVYEKAQIVVNPTYIGSGLKIKSVEALAHGKPLATWGNGLTGMGQDVPCLMSGHWQGIAQDVIELLSNAELRERLSSRAVDYIRERYTKECIYRPLREVIERGSAL